MTKIYPNEKKIIDPFSELEQRVYSALETYSNVHRGSGHNSIVSTHLYEQAREIILDYLELNKSKYSVIFCTPRGAKALIAKIQPDSYKAVSSQEIGLQLGVRALAIKKKSLPKGIPSLTGGGTARLVSPGWVVWAREPDKFEAGTPAIINIIAFANALKMVKRDGIDIFWATAKKNMSFNEIFYNDEYKNISGKELLDKLRQDLIGKDNKVPTSEGIIPYINLDNGASTSTFKPIWESVSQAWQLQKDSQKEIVAEVKSIIANILGAPLANYDVIFTSNTTEAINIAAENISKQICSGEESVILNTILEHNSNELPWRVIPQFSLIRLEVDNEGFVDLNKLENILVEYNEKHLYGKKRIKLIAISGASNVLGTMNDLEEISRLAHKYNAKILADAAQLIAHRKINIQKCDIDYLAFSAHKVYAPFGSGALIVRKGLLNFSPEDINLIQLSGEENIGGIAGLGRALNFLQRIGFDIIQEEEQALTKELLRDMAKIPGLTIYGIMDPESEKLTEKSGVIIFDLKKTWPQNIAKKLAENNGIGVRYGCHCSHMLIKRLLKIPPFIERFQGIIVRLFPKINLPGVVRVSLGIQNKKEDIEKFISALWEIARQRQENQDTHPSAKQSSTHLRKKDIKTEIDNFIASVMEKVYN